jgi:hypothetical protein
MHWASVKDELKASIWANLAPLPKRAPVISTVSKFALKLALVLDATFAPL